MTDAWRDSPIRIGKEDILAAVALLSDIFVLEKHLACFPFDELFVLGVERDNDLWLRAHVGTCDGRKGNAPLGRNYFLSNWELDKSVYGNGWTA